MTVEQVHEIVRKVYQRLTSIKQVQYAYIGLAGGCAAWLAGKTARQPNDIDIWFSTKPSLFNMAWKTLGITIDDNAPVYFDETSVHKEVIDGVEVNVIGITCYYSWRSPAEQLEKLISSFDVPQHRVGYVINDGELDIFINSPYYYDEWTVATMLCDSDEVVTKTSRAFKFKQAGYKMCDRIQLLAHMYEMGVDRRVLVTKDGVGLDTWVTWEELPGHIAKLALETATTRTNP
jgi:hypothetical protein